MDYNYAMQRLFHASALQLSSVSLKPNNRDTEIHVPHSGDFPCENQV